MTQPASLDLLLGESRALTAKIEKLNADAKEKEIAARTLRSEAGKSEISLVILDALSNSWDKRDPGKYGAASWFLTKEGRPCVVQELLPAGTPVFTNNDAWDEFKAELCAAKGLRHSFELEDHRPFGAVSPSYPVVPLIDTMHVACPACNTMRPVIMAYEQTDDGPDGDIWQKARYVLCCEELTPLGKPEHSSSRF